MQKMMTKAIASKTPRLYETDGQGNDAIVHAHYFSCFTGWDWYMTEYDHDTKQAFGLVRGFCDELGYFNIDEFERINRDHGHEVIERDLYWEPCKLGDCRR